MRRTLAVSLLALAGSTGAYAQAVSGAGAITGIVKDKYGDGIPDTTVTLSNKTNGVKRTMMTSDSGIFDAPGLVPASSYDLKVTRRGYADWELPSFDISVGETVNFRITLYADKADTPAEALRTLAPVEDSKTSLSTVVTETQIANLPTNGHLLERLILLAPAVTESPDGVLVFRGEAFTNSFVLDGLDATNRYFMTRPGIAPFVPQETISQMQVLSAGASAEFGHAPGGMVNAVSQSGVNRLHAAAYDYYNQNSWNAPDPFGNGFVPTGRENQGGVSTGLPISTDTLFLFGDLERVNDSSQELNRITNPLFTTSNGNSVSTTGCTATTTQCTTAANFIRAQMNVKVPTSLISTSGFARMDLRPNEHENFTVSGAILAKRSVNGLDLNPLVAPNGGLLGSNATWTNSTRYAAFGWTHVLSGTRVNDFHGYWFRDIITATSNPALFPNTGPLAINLAGTSLGGNPNYPLNTREQRFGGVDSFTWTIASHTLKLGADLGRNSDTMDQLWARYGLYNYTSFSSFATDLSANVKALKDYSSFIQTLGNSVTDLTTTQLQAFAQDTWKILPNLTIAAGVRWEEDRLPQPTEPNTNEYLTYTIPVQKTNFSPRVGFAYMLDKRTVLRAGYGTYFQPMPGQLLRDLFADGGVYQTYYELPPAATGATAFPGVLASTSSIGTPLQGEFFANAIFRTPYSGNGSAAIERRLNRYVSLALSYVQSEGLKLFSSTDQNVLGAAQYSETYNIENAQGTVVNTYPEQVFGGITSGSPSTITNAVFARRWEVNNGAGSRYHGATAQVRTAPLFGLSLQASYTWSHAYDDLSGPPVFSIIPSNYSPGNFATDSGPSLYDQRNRAVLNWTWMPVVNKKNDALSRYLLNGWRVSGIATYASTTYATPLVEVIGQQFSVGKLTMSYPSSLNGTGGWSRVPFENVNILPIGTHLSLDARVSRNVPFTPRLQGKLMFEVFNATNHQNNTAVNTIAYTAVTGNLTPVTGLGNPIADQAYPYGTGARRVQVAFRLDF